MTSLTHHGLTHRNTELLTLARADAFRAMLEANPRFIDVRLVEQPKAKGPARWYVSFRAANETCRQQLRELFQGVQDERGEQQWADYVVTRLGAERYRVENQHSGNGYVVTLHAAGDLCSCKQFLDRCAKEGLRCKHPRVVEIHLALELVQPGETSGSEDPFTVFDRPLDPERRARIRQMIDEDFGPE